MKIKTRQANMNVLNGLLELLVWLKRLESFVIAILSARAPLREIPSDLTANRYQWDVTCMQYIEVHRTLKTIRSALVQVWSQPADQQHF